MSRRNHQMRTNTIVSFIRCVEKSQRRKLFFRRDPFRGCFCSIFAWESFFRCSNMTVQFPVLGQFYKVYDGFKCFLMLLGTPHKRREQQKQTTASMNKEKKKQKNGIYGRRNLNCF